MGRFRSDSCLIIFQASRASHSRFPGRLTRDSRVSDLFIVKNQFVHRKKFVKNRFFNPRKNPGKVRENPEKNLGEVHVYFWRSTKSISRRWFFPSGKTLNVNVNANVKSKPLWSRCSAPVKSDGVLGLRRGRHQEPHPSDLTGA